MQLTIDSDQPLEDVLRVVGALYNVELAAIPTPRGSSDQKRSSNGSSSASPRQTRTSKRPAAKARPRAAARSRNGRRSAADIRSWAHANGYDVGRKGPLPQNVIDAYASSSSR